MNGLLERPRAHGPADEAPRCGVLVTGSREFEAYDVVLRALRTAADELAAEGCQGLTIIHGAAPGADTLAAQAAWAMGFAVDAHPAEWKRYGKAAGPRRNSEMLALQPGRVVAFHDDLSASRGTRDCVRQALTLGYSVALYDSKGTMQVILKGGHL